MNTNKETLAPPAGGTARAPGFVAQVGAPVFASQHSRACGCRAGRECGRRILLSVSV